MRELIEISEQRIAATSLDFIRDQIKILESVDRLIGIKGPRGVGKTTLLLQFFKTRLIGKKSLYVSLDDVFFTENRLIDIVDAFVKDGGEYLLIDEIHHYKNWIQELKNSYDRYPHLRVIFTGSSILQIDASKADLSRRAVIYKLQGLSLREYINLSTGLKLEKTSLAEIIENHESLSREIIKQIRPIQKFNEYIKFGYFPFYIENKLTYFQKLKETINLIIETDIPTVAEISFSNVEKIKQLLYIISKSVPFKPNVSKLSERIGLSRNALKLYLNLLNEAEVINSLYSDSKGISVLSKPEKIYLTHPNMMYALAGSEQNIGSVRESFFLNQVNFNYISNYTEKGDFLVDNKFLFEVGGRNKNQFQIKNIQNAFLALDDIETGYKNEIPLWLFGFLY